MDQNDKTTEEKIKISARKLFHIKGYAGTKTREIAEDAGINLALLNYYFRSKEKLFEIVMTESISDFFISLAPIYDNPNTTFEEKIVKIVDVYIDMLLNEPEIVMFIMSEFKANPEFFIGKIKVREIFFNSVLRTQALEKLEQKNISQSMFIQLIISFVGLTVFPFVSTPIIKTAMYISDIQFNTLMKERKKLIPMWLKAMIDSM